MTIIIIAILLSANLAALICVIILYKRVASVTDATIELVRSQSPSIISLWSHVGGHSERIHMLEIVAAKGKVTLQ